MRVESLELILHQDIDICQSLADERVRLLASSLSLEHQTQNSKLNYIRPLLNYTGIMKTTFIVIKTIEKHYCSTKCI